MNTRRLAPIPMAKVPLWSKWNVGAGLVLACAVAYGVCSKPRAAVEVATTTALALPSSTSSQDAAAAPLVPLDGPLRPALDAISDGRGGALIRVHFDWSPPCQVPVVYDVTKQGHAARLRMNVALEKRGSDLVMSMKNMSMIRYDDQDMTRPEVARALAPVTALMAVMPEAIISAKGEFVRVHELDAYVERLADTFERANDPNLVKLARVARIPTFKSILEGESRMLWGNWVESWLDVSLRPGTEVKGMTKNVVYGRSLEWPFSVQHRGAVREAPQLSLLSTNEKIKGKAAEALLGSVTANLIAQLDAAALPADFAAGIAMDRSNTVALDVARARPHHARYEVKFMAGNVSGTEIRDTAFDWSHATGCGT
ncbi:hypothetical protein LZC95_15030 [Pendulispora brunnea]|uniref:DUF1598 domain-containing protein n=1 Tax=Pendulispora brunnea TaxID=2905690 RepID=A0ABZ2KHW3_9BACT